MTLAVTGSTGALGQLVARALSEQGIEQRLLVRDLARAPELPGAAPVLFAYDDHDLARSALAGVDTLFMVSGAEAVDRLAQHRAFVDAAADSGVEHIVYTSFFGAAPECTFTLGRDHWATEEHIRASGMGFTFLRDNFYLELMADLVGEDGVIRGPAGDGRVSAVSRADIARCAVAALLDPTTHAGSTYDLTGPEALTFTEIAAILAARTGRAVTFHDETLDEAYASRLKWPAEQWEYDAWVSTYTAVARGELAAVSGDVRLLTGREPVSLETLLTDDSSTA
ncbi:SDR family oxidoreductase [Nocardioides sp. WS12]|uniref:SDR family oxidoreductase n=1 Tax=Nocardioides sp. WS12 TaxID=2486272 RepID=UPI0015FCD66C|nr:SDR family oxidoreductase [Nocardioides sp. WS12]